MTLNEANLNAFLNDMRDLDNAEDSHFTIDYRSEDGQVERLPELASELAPAERVIKR